MMSEIRQSLDEERFPEYKREKLRRMEEGESETAAQEKFARG